MYFPTYQVKPVFGQQFKPEVPVYKGLFLTVFTQVVNQSPKNKQLANNEPFLRPLLIKFVNFFYSLLLRF